VGCVVSLGLVFPDVSMEPSAFYCGVGDFLQIIIGLA